MSNTQRLGGTQTEFWLAGFSSIKEDSSRVGSCYEKPTIPLWSLLQ